MSNHEILCGISIMLYEAGSNPGVRQEVDHAPENIAVRAMDFGQSGSRARKTDIILFADSFCSEKAIGENLCIGIRKTTIFRPIHRLKTYVGRF